MFLRCANVRVSERAARGGGRGLEIAAISLGPALETAIPTGSGNARCADGFFGWAKEVRTGRHEAIRLIEGGVGVLGSTRIPSVSLPGPDCSGSVSRLSRIGLFWAAPGRGRIREGTRQFVVCLRGNKSFSRGPGRSTGETIDNQRETSPPIRIEWRRPWFEQREDSRATSDAHVLARERNERQAPPSSEYPSRRWGAIRRTGSGGCSMPLLVRAFGLHDYGLYLHILSISSSAAFLHLGVGPRVVEPHQSMYENLLREGRGS